MHKKIILTIIILIFILTGITFFAISQLDKNGKEKNDNYTHYHITDLSEYEIYNQYIVAEFPEYTDGQPLVSYWLLYQIAKDDFIVIDKNVKISSLNKGNIYFYKNRLYTTNILYGTYYYQLNEKNTKYTEIKFDASKISNGNIMYEEIEKVTDNYIYYNVRIKSDHVTKSIKCSLNDYKCEPYKES